MRGADNFLRAATLQDALKAVHPARTHYHDIRFADGRRPKNRPGSTLSRVRSIQSKRDLAIHRKPFAWCVVEAGGVIRVTLRIQAF